MKLKAPLLAGAVVVIKKVRVCCAWKFQDKRKAERERGEEEIEGKERKTQNQGNGKKQKVKK